MEPVVLNNRYRLVELVGSGGMAVVYRAVDTLLQRQVAIKVLREGFADDPAFLARFQREARAAAGLDHPNIVTVHDVGQDGDRHYIVMEYVDGQDLKTLVRQEGRLSVGKTLDIAIQTAEGVGHAHRAGIIHCDIKAQNVLLNRDGRAKVTDFGIARALSELGLTESETVWGSPLYFSPEQAAGEPPSPASDVYSIGVVIYEMLAGSPPFQAEKPAALALMHMREQPPPLAMRNVYVPEQLERIVRKVLVKEPSARYRSAGQLARVLEEYRTHSEQPTGWQPAIPAPEPVREAEPAPEPAADVERLTWLLGAIAFFAVAGLVVLWAMVYRAYSSQSAPPPMPTTMPLVTLSPTVYLVTVPDVVGKPMEEAREILTRQGLRFVLAEEREEPDVERGIVLSQSPASGQDVALDSEVSVVVSGAGRELTMQDLVGYPVELVREGLEADGLSVVVEEVWNPEPEGMVLEQQPEPDAVVRAGDTVTLTVSGGVDRPIVLEVNLADLITLQSAELRQRTFRPGGVIPLTLRWQALRPIDTHYVVFVHVIDPVNGNLVTQQDAEPFTPTSEWMPHAEVVDPHQVRIAGDQAAGRYQLRVGMYPQGQPSSRLPVVDAGHTTAQSDSILIAEIEIQ